MPDKLSKAVDQNGNMRMGIIVSEAVIQLYRRWRPLPGIHKSYQKAQRP